MSTIQSTGSVGDGTKLIGYHYPILDISYPIIQRTSDWRKVRGFNSVTSTASEGFNKWSEIDKIVNNSEIKMLPVEENELMRILYGGVYL